VHTVLVFSSILLVLSGGSALLRILGHIANWSQRRMVQFFVLTMPIVTLGLGVGGLHHFSRRFFLVGIAPWDAIFGVVLPFVMTAIALGALCLGVVRLFLMRRVVSQRGIPASLTLQRDVHILAQRLQITTPRVFICMYDRPLALTSGIFRPTVLLSIWMLKHLDQRELEAALAHELEHVARRDYLVMFLATLLRDAFFYVPTSRVVYQQLQQEKELVCDEIAVRVTQQPLALASALTKVWLHAVDGSWLPKWGVAQPLFEVGGVFHRRIERLLALDRSMVDNQSVGAGNLGMSLSAFVASLLVQIGNFLIILALIGCTPLAPLGKLF
jgi:Zn-dependent protease with chaperone function